MHFSSLNLNLYPILTLKEGIAKFNWYNVTDLVVGIDIIEIERIRRALNCFGERFLERVYTEREVEEVKGSVASLGARFAAKEAAMKALGGGITFREVEIRREGEAPHILFWGRAREKARRMNLRRVEVSLSHCRDYAVAIVVGEN